MTETQEWLVLLVAIIAGSLLAAAGVMIGIVIYDWARARWHRYKTRRQWYRW